MTLTTVAGVAPDDTVTPDPPLVPGRAAARLFTSGGSGGLPGLLATLARTAAHHDVDLAHRFADLSETARVLDRVRAAVARSLGTPLTEAQLLPNLTEAVADVGPLARAGDEVSHRTWPLPSVESHPHQVSIGEVLAPGRLDDLPADTREALLTLWESYATLGDQTHDALTDLAARTADAARQGHRRRLGSVTLSPETTADLDRAYGRLTGAAPEAAR